MIPKYFSQEAGLEIEGSKSDNKTKLWNVKKYICLFQNTETEYNPATAYFNRNLMIIFC